MRNVTMTDVAREAKISRQVVSDILNERNAIKVSDSTRERVLETVRRLNYKPNYQAKSLKEGATSCIGLMGGTHIVNLRLPYFADMGGCIDRRMIDTDAPHSLLVFGAGQSAAGQRNMDMVRKGLVDGLLVSMLSDEVEYVMSTVVPALEKMRVPFVLIHSLGREFGCSAVGVASGRGMYDGVKYLVCKGYRDIRYYVRNTQGALAEECVQGVFSALDDAGLRCGDGCLLQSPGKSMKGMYADAVSFARSLTDVPEAIICSSDEQAVGLVHGFRARGMRVPDDVAVIGRNGSLPHPMFGNELTSVLHPMQEKCDAALAMLEDMMSGTAGTGDNENVILTPGIHTGRTA